MEAPTETVGEPNGQQNEHATDTNQHNQHETDTNQHTTDTNQHATNTTQLTTPPTTNDLPSLDEGHVILDNEPEYAKLQRRNSIPIPTYFSQQVGCANFIKSRLIGEGAVGKVYLVKSVGLGKPKYYAMKILNKKRMVDKQKVQRALNEKHILSLSNHPFICTLHYCFQTKRNLYLVMQLCAGGDLYHLQRSRPDHVFTEDQARFYAAEIFLALEYLHVLGFVYRDLKPSNILVHASGHLVLTDFDLAYVGQSENQGKSDSIYTPRANSFVGTDPYIAPEIILGGTPYSGIVDWWSYGVWIYEMLFAKWVFHGEDQVSTFARIIDKKNKAKIPKAPSKLMKSVLQRSSTSATESSEKSTMGDTLSGPPQKVSSQCKKFIKKLLNKNPHKRLTNPTKIKQHKWFKKIHWALIRHETPPLVPALSDEDDLRYFPPVDEDFVPSEDEDDDYFMEEGGDDSDIIEEGDEEEYASTEEDDAIEESPLSTPDTATQTGNGEQPVDRGAIQETQNTATPSLHIDTTPPKADIPVRSRSISPRKRRTSSPRKRVSSTGSISPRRRSPRKLQPVGEVDKVFGEFNFKRDVDPHWES